MSKPELYLVTFISCKKSRLIFRKPKNQIINYVMFPIVDILMSTYNGELFIRKQLDSLVNQEFDSWRLLVRDDGSRDDTLSILMEYKNKYPSKIVLVNDADGNIGPAYSFSKLMQISDAPYVAFCDQDDVWLPEKLKKQTQIMFQKEQKFSPSLPILIHSDLLVVDYDLFVLSNSFWKYQKLDPKCMGSIERILMQNYVTGCTVLANRALINLATPIPPKAIMHDWWLALVAITNGKIVDIDEPLMLYRQHKHNANGAVYWGCQYFYEAIAAHPNLLRVSISKTRDQASDLLSRGFLDHNSWSVVDRYIKLFESNWFKRRLEIMQGGYMKYGYLRNLAVFVLI